MRVTTPRMWLRPASRLIYPPDVVLELYIPVRSHCAFHSVLYPAWVTDSTATPDSFAEALPDPVALRARIAQQVEDARKHAASVSAMNERLQRIEGSASSPGGDVRVRVNAKCVVTNLELGEHTIRLGRRTLAKLIMETMMDAQRNVARQALAEAEHTLNEETIAQMRAEYEQQLGYIDDESPNDTDQPSRRHTPGAAWNR